MRLDSEIFDTIVGCLQNSKDKHGRFLNMDSIIISQDAATFDHYFTESAELNDLRSISKPVLCLALGIAIDDGIEMGNSRVTLDTKIWPFFQDRVHVSNRNNIDKLEKITLRHVLTHTMGYGVGFMFSKDIKDRDHNTLLDYIFNTDIIYEPGEIFVYTNVGPYVISALIQEELGINAAKWVEHLLFSKLDIVNYQWKNYGPYCAGSSGLHLSNVDLHKIGLLLLSGGIYNGQRVVSEAWVNMMSSLQVGTPTMYDESRVFPKYGYGFYLYICKNGDFYCDGTDGQYLIVLRENGFVITTLGHQSDMKPITECFRRLL